VCVWVCVHVRAAKVVDPKTGTGLYPMFTGNMDMLGIFAGITSSYMAS
jgi:hypothetical protein